MHKRDIFLIFYNNGLVCVSLESPHRGDSNENTQYTIFNIKKEIVALNYPKSAAMGFSQGTQKRVRNSHGKRVISVRAIETLLYVVFYLFTLTKL